MTNKHKEQANLFKGTAIVCCEYPKNGCEVFGEPMPEPKVYVVVRDPSPHEITFFKFRQRYNPELRYYILKVEKNITNEQIAEHAKMTKFKEPIYFDLSKY